MMRYLSDIMSVYLQFYCSMKKGGSITPTAWFPISISMVSIYLTHGCRFVQMVADRLRVDEANPQLRNL